MTPFGYSDHLDMRIKWQVAHTEYSSPAPFFLCLVSHTALSGSTARSTAWPLAAPCSALAVGPLAEHAQGRLCGALWDSRAGSGAAWEWAARAAALIPSSGRGEQARSCETRAGLLASPAQGLATPHQRSWLFLTGLCSVQPAQWCV